MCHFMCMIHSMKRYAKWALCIHYMEGYCGIVLLTKYNGLSVVIYYNFRYC